VNKGQKGHAVPSAAAIEVADHLSRLGADEVYALLVPFQPRQDDRARALDHYADVVAELREAGWELETGVRPTPTGDALWLAVIARPPKET
jgi:hypothetical protein